MKSRFFLLAVALELLSGSGSVHSQTNTLAFTGMRLIDGSDGRAVDNAVLLVRDGRVVAAGPVGRVSVPDTATRISLTGKVVIPGLINAHGHVNDVDRVLPLYAKYGVTTVFSLGNDNNAAAAVATRDVQDRSWQPRSRLFTAGRIVTADTPESARAQVRANADARVDLIKIRVDDNLGTTARMPPSAYRAVIEEAHARGLRVAAHMFYLSDTKQLLAAGVDLLAHSVRDVPVDGDLIKQLKARDVCVIPTLMRDVSTFVYESTPTFFSDPLFLQYAEAADIKVLQDPARQQARRDDPNTPRNKAALEMARRNLKILADAGVRIAMGTDTGAGPGRFTGYFELLEVEMMTRAGLTPGQALRAATREAAACMGRGEDLGTLTPGKWADMLVLDADPLIDAANLRRISSVYIRGQQVLR